jgi:hypothetical protein
MWLLPVGEMAMSTGTRAATQPSHYAWWFPGSPVRVHLDLRVIQGLQERLRDTGRGTDEHGLLFGRVQEGATEILEFRPAFDRSVPEMIVELSPEPGKRLVGYYRTGDVLRLSEEDLSLFKTFFGKPYHVFLMMQPNGFGPANATFFFSQGNQRVSEFPFLEFPLDASLLATEERDRLSRCRQASQLPATPPEPVPPEPGKAQKQKRLFPRLALGTVAVAVLLVPALWFTNPVFRERSIRVWSAMRTMPQPQAAPVSSPPPQSGLGLQVKRQAGDLNLAWDHKSPTVTAATSGFLSIEDGTLKRKISLDAQQLRGESILYSPVSDQVLIQLTLSGPTGGATESVRVIRGQEIPRYATPAPTPQLPANPIPVAQASKPFTAPPVVKKSAPAPQPLNAPPILPAGQEHPAYAISAPVAPPQPLPASTPAPAASLTAPLPVYNPPVPVRKILPGYPPELKGVSSKPIVVAIRVVIDKGGKVVKAEPLPQQNVHQLFVREALHAAELWRFQPARRGEEPVGSESVLRFSFSQ